MITRRALALGLAGLTAGCGFRPVYGTRQPGAGALATVFVGVIPNRAGQLFRQALQARFEGEGGGGPKRYTLSVAYFEFGQGIGTLFNSFTTRTRSIGTAGWSLHPGDDLHSEITKGTARSVDGYNQIDEQFFYADLSEDAVERRLAQALADQIALALTVYFDKHPAARA